MLLAIKFDDKLLVNRTIDIITSGQRRDSGAHISAFCRRNPTRTSTSCSGLPGPLNMRILPATFPYRDDVSDLYLERRNVDLASVYFDVPVIHKLPRLPARCRKSCAIHRVIQSSLQERQ